MFGETDYSTQRLLFRKIVKGFEEQESVLADYELKIRSLEVQLEKARPRKRKKVKTSPNSKFVDIKAIYEAQMVVGEAEEQDNDGEEDNNPESTLDCILVE
jgi:hypothetical protein